jgi:hypothetical protein
LEKEFLMVRKLLLAAIAVSFLGATTPENPARAKNNKLTADPDLTDISGYYTCKGNEAGGKPYSGICVITKKSDIYLVQWVIGAGSTFLGVGIRQGQTLATSWAIPGDKGGVIRGINLYKIESGPRLVGRWTTLPGPGIQQTETLTFLKNLDPERDVD